eukprot:c14375_g1_i1.p1 GENE.c14375_g1_i1~~c14375_g1_i1.p1  ORF type:complete len:227 (-),score=70.53 c14375_g1_i1:10-690(-)
MFMKNIIFALLISFIVCDHDCLFDGATCDVCASSDSQSCNNAIVSYCNSVNWTVSACVDVSVECPFVLENNPCGSYECQYSSNEDCSQAIINYCTSLHAQGILSAEPGCEGFQVPSACVNDDATVLAFASGVRYGNVVTGCDWLAQRHYCKSPTYGKLVRSFCPLACGGCTIGSNCFMNDDNTIHDAATIVGFGRYIKKCSDARQYIDCDHPKYGGVMRAYCPCSC